MSESKQTTIDIGSYNKKSDSDAVGIGKIKDQKIHISDYHITRGKPSMYTPKDQIGQDGLTEFHLISTKEVFKLKNSKGVDSEINGFFITKAIEQQIKRVPNYAEELSSGNVLGPCKIGQKISTKTNKPYWCLIFPNEEGY